jgi:hypothetical protein
MENMGAFDNNESFNFMFPPVAFWGYGKANMTNDQPIGILLSCGSSIHYSQNFKRGT